MTDLQAAIESDDEHATSDDPLYLKMRDAALTFAFAVKALKDRHPGDPRFEPFEPIAFLGMLDGITESYFEDLNRRVH